MAIKIGHAVYDENGKSTGGAAGDQTGKEVRTQAWYNRAKGWAAVFRAKDKAVAEKIAKAMEQACKNDNIGYDQNQRTTLYTKAKEANWNLSKITAKCECDCSSLVAVCVNAAGIKVSKDMYTGNERDVLEATNAFDVLEGDRYLYDDSYLMRGDILLGAGHTAVALEDGDMAHINTAVLAWQYACIADGFFLAADGVWGAECVATAKKAIVKKRTTYQNKNLTKIVQRAVGATVDGKCGSKTASAIKSYQKKHGLTVDGAVGLNTWKKILGVST